MKKRMLFLTLMTFFTTNLYAATASWYGDKPWEGRKTASGEIFRSHGTTAACAPQYKLHTKLHVTNKNKGKSVIFTMSWR